MISPKPQDPLLREERTVTIAAGFKCTDGVILCSDTEETVGDYGKRSRAKILVRPQTNPIPPIQIPRRKGDMSPRPVPAIMPEVVAAFAGAGNSDFIDKLVDKLWDALVIPGSFADRVAALEDATIEFHQKYWPVYPVDIRPEAHLMVCLWTQAQCGLFKVIGPLVNEIRGFASVGYGMSLANYLTERFYNQQLSIKDATSIAIYLLQEVKEHVGYCGGDSHVLLMKPEGYAYFEYPANVRLAGERFRKLEEAVSPLILSSGNSDIAPEDFDKATEEFTSKLRRIREELQQYQRALDAAADYFPWK